MTVFDMAAAQMLFNDEDRLWHLASHPGLEASGALHARPGEWARIFLLTKVSAAERQVLDLLRGESLTQAGIATRLSLSPRTVETHLRSVYHKAAEHWDLPDVNQAQLVRLLAPFYQWTGGIQGKNE